MVDTQRQLQLTTELVGRAHRTVPDSGPPPGLIRTNRTDWDANVGEILTSRPRGKSLWVFAYGSLLWNPVLEPVEERTGVARGWHRSFCIRMRDWRGTVDQPGLMMALDRGGQCKGIVYRLAEDNLESQLEKLVRREIPVKPFNQPPTNIPRWIRVQTREESLRAVAFVVNPRGYSYAGGLLPDETADILATACGHGGSCAEYLHNTVVHLERLGIRDSGLWRLQSLVANRLSSVTA